jgi:hypothetical protein
MRYVLLSALSVLVLTGAGPVQPDDSQAVHDECELFSWEADQFAEQRAQNVWERFGYNVRIDVVNEPPEKDRQRLRKMSQREAAKYFSGWAAERAKAAHVDGVYVLINPGRPRHIQVIAWPEERRKEFTEFDCEGLRRTFVEVENRSGPDEALYEMLRKLEETLAIKNAPPGPWRALLWWIVGLLGLAVVLGLLRMWLNARRPAEGAVKAAPRGLMPGLLGGLFGTAAGLWIYDSLFRRHSAQAQPEPVAPPAAPGQESSADPGPDGAA